MELNLKKIKGLCFTRKITLKQLAQKTGISQTALTMAMHINSTSIETLYTLSKFFGVPMEYFFSEGDITYYDHLSFYTDLRNKLIQSLWNCPPAINESMNYYISQLYETQRKINILITNNTEENETDTDDNENSPAP